MIINVLDLIFMVWFAKWRERKWQGAKQGVRDEKTTESVFCKNQTSPTQQNDISTLASTLQASNGADTTQSNVTVSVCWALISVIFCWDGKKEEKKCLITFDVWTLFQTVLSTCFCLPINEIKPECNRVLIGTEMLPWLRTVTSRNET